VGLKRGPLSLVRITEELLEWNSSDSGSTKSILTAVYRTQVYMTYLLKMSSEITSVSGGNTSITLYSNNSKQFIHNYSAHVNIYRNTAQSNVSAMVI
jgi:hypothetical protein